MALISEYRGILTGLGLVAIAVLVAISVDFGIPGQELLQSLRFHIVAVCLVLPILLSFGRARWRSMVLLALLLASAGQGLLIINDQLQRRTMLVDPAASVSLLSFNMLGDNPESRRVAQYLVDTLPDVAVLLEADGIQSNLAQVLGAYPTKVGCDSPASCDAAILTRLPVKQSRIFEFGATRRQRLILVTVDVGGAQLTVIATHLSKPYFDRFSAVELKQLTELLTYIEGPVVVAGDFNGAPWSNSINTFVSDSNLAPGPAMPATWPVDLGPLGVPIDNMFSRDGAAIRTITALSDALGSNHRGLLATIDVAPRAR